MKGNRLNTAANVGGFVTGRQQLGVQRQLLEQGSAQAHLSAMQLDQITKANADAEMARVQQWIREKVASGRITQREAELEIATQAFNARNPPPASHERIAGSFIGRVAASLTYFGSPAGWYKEGRGGRYWSGQRWTLVTASRKELLRHIEAGTIPDDVLPSDAPDGAPAVTPAPPVAPLPQQLPADVPPPPTIPDGWYSDSTSGLQRYWQDGAWTQQTRPSPPAHPA
ncbi:DUF2510 domain-containing protein [Arthrobacter sp. CAN_C5]|uniref:DUF2510 domain-containing protein n=1 Tax=Arthrobacter sp. CAN_C5 TaxID=2760706 RepID=UPI001AE35123|nr:DUF2510 domain-containing protein [Arthrobacter sp. CAN_C5]MBP2215999.1 hypothetical protein [Arthrobacter sp. CAN_C5]